MAFAVSLSGGKDSTAMLLMMLERGEQVDKVVFWDSGVEFPQMYEHLERLEAFTGIAVTRVSIKESFEWWLCERELTRGGRAGQHGYGWARPNARWCTRLKTIALDAETRGMTKCIGIAADEKRPLVDGVRYPLIEYGVTERDALDYCLAHGFDWGGLYNDFKRVSCFLCPLKGLDELRTLRRNYPELWSEMGRLDILSPNQFRRDYSIADLEARFSAEDMQMEMEL